MSFDDYDGPVPERAMAMAECKPDYEAQAASVKKKIDVFNELEATLFKFKRVNGVSSFRNISSFAEFVGGVAIKKSELSDRYEELLSQIEKTA